MVVVVVELVVLVVEVEVVVLLVLLEVLVVVVVLVVDVAVVVVIVAVVVVCRGTHLHSPDSSSSRHMRSGLGQRTASSSQSSGSQDRLSDRHRQPSLVHRHTSPARQPPSLHIRGL
jgi:hypothetical protein